MVVATSLSGPFDVSCALLVHLHPQSACLEAVPRRGRPGRGRWLRQHWTAYLRELVDGVGAQASALTMAPATQIAEARWLEQATRMNRGDDDVWRGEEHVQLDSPDFMNPVSCKAAARLFDLRKISASQSTFRSNASGRAPCLQAYLPP